MLDPKIESGIDRFVGYIRRMNSLTNDELLVVLMSEFNQNSEGYVGMGIGVGLEGHIDYIREMGMMSDDKIRKWLRDSVYKDKDPIMREVFEDIGKQKSLLNAKKAAKDLKGDPRAFARKVDRDL